MDRKDAKTSDLRKDLESQSETGGGTGGDGDILDASVVGDLARVSQAYRAPSSARVALEIYALGIILVSFGIVAATYAYSIRRWHDGNGSPLKDEPSVNMGTPLSATDQVGDLAFRRYVAFVAAATCMLTGFGAEIVVGKSIVSALSTKTGTTLWKFSQLIFSLMLLVAILAAGFHDVMALPFLVAGLWKFGFPETIGSFLEARALGFTGSARDRVLAVCSFLDGLGAVLHHAAGVLFVVVVLVGLAPLSRPMIAASLPLVIQHWFCLLRYRNGLLYGLVMAGAEIFWEFELIASLPQFTAANGFDRVVRPIAYLMLEAHWVYWVAGIARFCVPADGRPLLKRRRTNENWRELLSNARNSSSSSLRRDSNRSLGRDSNKSNKSLKSVLSTLTEKVDILQASVTSERKSESSA